MFEFGEDVFVILKNIEESSKLEVAPATVLFANNFEVVVERKIARNAMMHHRIPSADWDKCIFRQRENAESVLSL